MVVIQRDLSNINRTVVKGTLEQVVKQEWSEDLGTILGNMM